MSKAELKSELKHASTVRKNQLTVNGIHKESPLLLRCPVGAKITTVREKEEKLLLICAIKFILKPPLKI